MTTSLWVVAVVVAACGQVEGEVPANRGRQVGSVDEASAGSEERDGDASKKSDDRLQQALAEAVTALQADQYDVRQSAMERLWAAGDKARPVLEQARRSDSAEVRARAQFVLENLELGITFGTPRGIAREVFRFRSGTAEGRRKAIQRLEEAGQHRLILSLLRTETDQRLREEWSFSLERTVRRAIVAGDLDAAADTLRRAADGPAWMRHHAAFAAQRGEVDDELARLPETLAARSTTDAQHRAYLQRAKGDLAGACRSAEQVSENFLLLLLAENREWGPAARRVAARIPQDPASAEVESLGLAAAYYRLAGDPAASARFVQRLMARGNITSDELSQRHERDSQRQDALARHWQVGKAVLLLGHYDGAFKLVQRDQLPFVFELLCDQHRYREAFQLLGMTYPDGFGTAWFRKVAAESPEDSAAVEKEFVIAQLIIRHLHFLGKRDAAVEYLGVLEEAALLDRGTRRLRMLCETAVKMSWRERAWELAAKVIEKEERPNVLSVLYPARSAAATMWWSYLSDTVGNRNPREILARIDQLLLNPPMANQGPDDFQSLAETVSARIPLMLESRQAEWWHELAETALIHRRRDLASAFYAQAAGSSLTDALKLGDMHAADGNWGAAADVYARAWKSDRDKPLPMYLHARALQRSGQEAEGSRLAELALLMPLANEDLRHGLAMGLKERGYREEARQQFELLLHTGEPQSSPVVDAAKQIGNLVYAREPLRAADCWQTLLLCCLKPSWGFVENGGYIQIPFLVHKTRAKGLLQLGRADEAWEEVKDSEAAWPGNIELAEELVPMFESAGRVQQADELFSRTAGRLRELLAAFPDCATLHNNLAWLCGRSNRALDEGLVHARRALEIEPDKPSFLDTYAEVCFRRGQIADAIQAAERCVKADPESMHYRRQLERFRQAQPSAPAL